MKKQVPAPKSSSRYEFPSLSPQHDRVDYSRKILRINDAIRSILSVSHMERMDLIAINNRSLCNHSKVKRAERTTRKHSNKSNLPDLKELRLDNRRENVLRAQRGQSISADLGTGLIPHGEGEAELCERYIEEYIQRLKEEKRYDILCDRAKLISQACRDIMLKLELGRQKPSKAEKLLSVEVDLREVRLPINARKARSITEIEYCEEINRIRRSSEYSSKARALNEKLFLRKMRQIKLHSQPE